MKKNLLIIVLTAIICISATTITSNVVSKPATPRVVKHQEFNNIAEADLFIGYCIRNGFIIKSVIVFETGSSYSHTYVIAEKY